MDEIDAFFDGLGQDRDPIVLDRYAAGMDLETYLWFESRFQDGARRILANSKKDEAREIVKMARKAGGLITEAALLERHPQLIAWLADSFGSGF